MPETRGSRSNLQPTSGASGSHPIPTHPIQFSKSTRKPSNYEPIEIVTAIPKAFRPSPTCLILLRKKQRRLITSASSIIESLPSPDLLKALQATLIFAQHEAGTAVCVHPDGWILTCAHCFGDCEDEWKENTRKWLLTYTGLAILVECRHWDSKRDLALAKVIMVETSTGQPSDTIVFKSIQLSVKPPPTRTPIVCIGQPGADDLESATDRRTNYNLVEISEGTYRGLMPGSDPQDNSQIGALRHDAWTYWGHSGAPLLRQSDGSLIGLHSSWDDQTGLRHGVPLVAIKHFLDTYLPLEHVPSNIAASSTSSSGTIIPTNLEQTIDLVYIGPKDQSVDSKQDTEQPKYNNAANPIIIIDDDEE